jgi:hypothetical protein
MNKRKWFNFLYKPPEYDDEPEPRILIFDGLAEHLEPDKPFDGWPGPKTEFLNDFFFPNPLIEAACFKSLSFPW